MKQQPTVLLIDDEWGRTDDPFIVARYGRLSYRWVQESAAAKSGEYSARLALARVRRESPTVVLLDVMFGSDRSRLGIEILRRLRVEFPSLPVIIFSRLDSDEHRDLVIQCMELGANEYLEKAPDAARMQAVLDMYVSGDADGAIYGNSPSIRLLRSKIARVAFSGETSVLIVGESGTGKELVARALHRQGPHREGRFVAKNCAQSEIQLLGSELFGHELGSFTGAIEQRRGLIEEANDGVLFLDEIADMPLELQARLLRTLETRVYRRLGATRDLQSRFQLLCASNRSPEELIRSGRLREDFYYRVATMTLHVPPLRERGEDVVVLAGHFLRRFKLHGGGAFPGHRISEEFAQGLRRHTWPGNVRELRNVIERAVILSRRALLGAEELAEVLEPLGSKSQRTSRDSFGRRAAPLPDAEWPKQRVIAELTLALSLRRQVQTYKGRQWKAEFMRLMYPGCKAANAKGFNDLIKRLTGGPWGYPRWREEPEITDLLRTLSE